MPTGRRPRRSTVVFLVSVAAVVALGAVLVLVPGLAQRLVVNPVIEALGGVTCDETTCPPDAPWVYPVDGPVTSGFRTESRPDHHGADVPAPHGTAVVAASAGVVTISECQARLDGEPYGCDRDGGAEVRGCGWFVQILHAEHIGTLYCHLQRQPEVTPGDTVRTGDLIGYVGSSGNSSEPHLHFEVQTGSTFSPPRSANAIDPEPFLAERATPAP